jgi:hypothetical protein
MRIRTPLGSLAAYLERNRRNRGEADRMSLHAGDLFRW